MHLRIGVRIRAVAFVLAAFVARSPGQVPSPPRSDGIEAILVADTLRGPAGTDQSLRAMDFFLTSLRELRCDVGVTTIAGDRVTPAGILGTIRRLDTRMMARRTLLVYYAGHGGTDPRIGHFLRTPRGDLARSVLLAEIRAKSPRLAIVLTDCCSTRAVFKAVLPRPPEPPDQRAVDNLLFQHTGVVDMNASTCDPARGVYQAAFYHPATGGLFTTEFTRMFEPARGFRERPDVSSEEAERRAYGRRFSTSRLIDYDHDKDGFIEWSEAREYLDVAVLESFHAFRSMARDNELLQIASPADLRLLMMQASQDPQIFGPLAVRSDRTPKVSTPVEPARRPRLGATFLERYERGGAYLEVAGVDPRSPAAKVTVWRKAKRDKTPSTLTRGDTIMWANKARIRSMADLARVLDRIPEGGELNIVGYDASTGRAETYEATAVLDRFE